MAAAAGWTWRRLLKGHGRRRCNDEHTWYWNIDDDGVAIEHCWFCSATRGTAERMAVPPKHMKPKG